jgi:hypothetical protein
MLEKTLVACLAAAALTTFTGCGSNEKAPLPGAESTSESHAPAHPTTTQPAAPAPTESETEGSFPLKLTGIGSKAELDRALAKIDDPAVKAQFEHGFRGCFTNDRSARAYADAVPAMESVLARMPDFAPAYRVLAYATFNLDFDMVGSTRYYEKAVAADPTYGEAHYALSFMLTQSDLERGRQHFERAMELGVPDERDLAGQFYPPTGS